MRLFRNILNIIFIFGALIGMYTGTIIIIVAMAFKLIEVIIRLLKLEDKN